ncbi:type VII secretion protein EccCb [Mycolicibacterium mengxianglii]|uniref:type VII secretion protein EccCb n=1 Tax=Mycolicibacterium mengxianglii TaxID=2736649 RepID=UPI0018EEF9F5|nr:type VII secretion protein EccCb [Mycolicibacterium mengxianglii]
MNYTFLDLDRAPHVAAVITNLADEAYLVDRMQDALEGEIHRRQQLLRSAGNLPTATAYTQARTTRTELPALPALFVIVDEFSELLSRQPDFIEVFVAIGRLGRSLGMHLLLASQRLDEGRLRGLESHLSYRICLKTLSPNESRTVIGTPDAYHLPATPGAAFLKVGADEPVRFQATHVSGAVPRAPGRRSTRLVGPVRFTCAHSGPVRPVTGELCETATDRRVLDAVLDVVEGHGPPAHRVWLAPVSSSPTLDSLLADVPAGSLRIPIGIADRAFEQRVAPVILDLAGAAGNIAIVGAPQSGKSTAARTVALALSGTCDPAQVQLYCLDFGGGSLGALGELPHVGVVAGRQQPELVRRTVEHVAAVVQRREVLFGALGVGSMAEFRLRQAAGYGDPYGEVFLIVDGWASLRQEFLDLEPTIAGLAAEGLSYGVHVLLTASRWADIRPALKDLIGTRIELRLGDPVDSELDRKRARLVPRDRPGSGLAPDGFPMVVALPRLDGQATDRGLTQALAAAAGRLTSRHGDLRAPVVMMLPDQLDYDDVDLPQHPLLGLGDDEFTVVAMDFSEQAHLLISGDAGSGKTSALRLLGREIARTSPPGAAQLYLIDPRRTLLDIEGPVAGYATTTTQCTESVAALTAMLGARLPEAAIDARQLRRRSWWTGPEVYVLVDDYDVLSGNSPLAALVELIPQAPDIGLHLIVAGRGSARSLYDPLLSALRESGAATMQLSQHADDAALAGAGRPRQLRPGRAMLTRRSGRQLVQLAWVAPQ